VLFGRILNLPLNERHQPIRQAGHKQGVQIDVWIRPKRGKRSMVERTHKETNGYAYCAAWLGWTLDAFDFTVFLLIMAPIAQEFGVSADRAVQ
jgi:hypothetical protein